MPKRMAKGTVWLMGAQVAFLVSGYIIHFGLGRMLGPAEYGTFGVVISLLGIISIFLQTGVPQAVSKYVAEGRQILSVNKNALSIQSIFLILCFSALFFLAPHMSRLLGDESLTGYIQLVSFYIPIFSIGQLFMGVLNGKRLFEHQAAIISANSIVKPISVFLLVLMGLSISGAIGGYIISGLFTLLLSFYFMRRITNREDGASLKTAEMLYFAGPIIIYSICLISIRSIDVLFIKGLIGDKDVVGIYTSAWAISILPLGVFSGLSMTLLPSVSSSIIKKDIGLTLSYIKNSIRYSLMILLPIALLIAANPERILAFFYTSQYATGGGALRILILGMVFYTFFTVFNTVIIAQGKPHIPMFFVISLLLLGVVLNFVFIPRHGIEGAALATAVTSGIGMVAGLFYLHNKFGKISDNVSTIKILFSAIIVYLMAILLPFHGILLICTYVLLLLVYFCLLWALKEIKSEDIDMVKGLFR